MIKNTSASKHLFATEKKKKELGVLFSILFFLDFFFLPVSISKSFSWPLLIAHRCHPLKKYNLKKAALLFLASPALPWEPVIDKSIFARFSLTSVRRESHRHAVGSSATCSCPYLSSRGGLGQEAVAVVCLSVWDLCVCAIRTGVRFDKKSECRATNIETLANATR